MSQFELGSRPYLAWARRWDVKPNQKDTIQLAIYAPGTICSDWHRHHQRAGSLSYGFVICQVDHSDWRPRSTWRLYGSQCVQRHREHSRPQAWQTVLDQRHPLIGTGLKANWRDQAKRRYWRLVPLIGLMLQVEPEHGLLRGYLGLAAGQGKRPFTSSFIPAPLSGIMSLHQLDSIVEFQPK